MVKYCSRDYIIYFILLANGPTMQQTGDKPSKYFILFRQVLILYISYMHESSCSTPSSRLDPEVDLIAKHARHTHLSGDLSQKYDSTHINKQTDEASVSNDKYILRKQ